jgi:hypothetical protein
VIGVGWERWRHGEGGKVTQTIGGMFARFG